MKKIPYLLILFFISSALGAQKVDSIFFHLYTDSLKKGQYNYINVDGKLSNGHWLPLGEKEIEFSCAQARFEGNDLVIPDDFREKKVTVKAILKSDRSIWIERTIWIKQKPDPLLPRQEDIMNGDQPKKKRDKRG